MKEPSDDYDERNETEEGGGAPAVAGDRAAVALAQGSSDPRRFWAGNLPKLEWGTPWLT